MSTTYPIKNQNSLQVFKNYYVTVKPNPRNYTLIVLGLNTAFRISDLLRLKWKNVYDLSKMKFREHISMTEQKTKKERIVAINQITLDALSNYFNQYFVEGPSRQSSRSCRHDFDPLPAGINDEAYLFPSAKNHLLPITRIQAYRIIKEAALSAGLPQHISCHSLRKTFGYHAWQQGIPPAMLMELYNHSSYKTTKRYLCIEQDEKDDVYRKVQL